ncbi:hypothetical protein AGOR_G00037310 [Albula goreensis]|uniref:C2H2-type domain-containing protein n=1 Tax=Albula goreensis TaxID=1534307 RepID=A0A8T3DXM3_9TELE|nr:hypothetical protein AGOR_G00037310 [Albula goreensis]
MKSKIILCQVCGLRFDGLSLYKTHARGKAHQQKVAEVFQTEAPHSGQVRFPHIVLENLFNPNWTKPVIGLQLLSICINTEETALPLYLCHACQEKCQSNAIVAHLTSTEHCFSVFAYMNPERLSFGWIHPPAAVPGLKGKAIEEKQQHTVVLRLIDIPKKVFENMKTAPYSQTIKELTQTDRLKEVYRADFPERMKLQEYLTNPARTFPLLGLNFVVEYRCLSSEKLCGYLCMLCRKRVRETQVIAHVIGFDHIFWYLDLVHPSSLCVKSSYRFYSVKYSIMILDLAMQAQKIGSSGGVQEMTLDPEVFTAVETGSYAAALERLQAIWKEQNQSDIQPHVTPGQKLVALNDVAQSSAPQKHVQIPQNMAPDRAGQSSVVMSGKTVRLSCQVCGTGPNFFCISDYKNHVRGVQHNRRMETVFQTERHRPVVAVPRLVLYEYIVDQQRKDPVIGLNHVTCCIDAGDVKAPIYLCHTCQDKCTSHVIVAHLTSYDHYFCTLALRDPKRLHFGWIPSQDMLSILRPQVLAVENQHGVGTMQMLYLPEKIYKKIGATPYLPTLKALCQTKEMTERLRLKKYTKLHAYLGDSTRKHPLLGLKFLVEYKSKEPNNICGYLCLLCKKRIRETLVIAHIIGFEHVFCYLDLTHPSSLGSKSLYKHYDAQYSTMILDLASQAEKIDSHEKIKVIKLDLAIYEEVDSAEFSKALNLLQTIWREEMQSDLQPVVIPGQRLFPKNLKPGMCLESKNLGQSSEHAKPGQSSEHAKPGQSSEHAKPGQSSEHAKPGQSSEHAKPGQSSEHAKPGQSSEHAKPGQSSEHAKPGQSSEHAKPGQSSEHAKPGQSSEHAKPGQSSEHAKPGQSSELLWDFLKNKARKEPVIGLSAVIECASDDLPPYYLCEVCAEKFAQDYIIGHLISPHHRYRYLKSQHLLCGWGELPDLSKRIEVLKERAAAVEQESGFGEAKVLELDTTQYKEIFSSTSDVALKKLQTIQRPQMLEQLRQCDFQPPVISENKPVTVKQENVPVSDEGSSQEVKKASESTAILKPGEEPELNIHLKNTENKLFIGEASETRMSKVLGRYLNSELRKEPVIGLNSIIEYQGDNQTNCLECKVCCRKLSVNCIIGHLLGPRHRYMYIKSKYPKLLDGWKDNPDLTGNIHKLRTMAKKLEEEEGLGQFKVMEVGNPSVREMGLPSVHKEHPTQLQAISLSSGASGKSDFFPVLKKGRTKPMIGLKEVTECRTKGQQPFYLCNICRAKIPMNHVLGHVTGAHHRYNYIKAQYPSLLKRNVKKNKLHMISKDLLQLAVIIKEKESAIEDVQIMELSEEQHMKLFAMSVENALKNLQMMQKEQNQKKEDRKVTVKQEVEDQSCSETCTEESIQDPQHIDTEQASNTKETAPTSVALHKPFPDPKPKETELCKQNCEGTKSMQVHAVPVREKAACSPVILEPPVTEWKSTEIRQAAVEQDMGKVQAVLEESESTEENTASMYPEKVCYQMTSRVSLQFTQIDATKRVEIPLGESHLSKFLLPFMTHRPEPLVGLQAVVECRSLKQPTFYFCLTCAKKINKSCICNHIISDQHQYCYIDSQYPDLIPDWQKNPIDVAMRVEAYEKIWDVQVMKLDLKLYEQVASAPFNMALNLLQKIQREQRHHQPLMTRGHRPIYFSEKRFQSPGAPQEPYQELVERQRVSHGEHGVGNGAAQQEPRTQFEKPHQSKVCVGEKRIQGLGAPQEAYQDLKVVERQRVTNREDIIENGRIQQAPMAQSQKADQTKVEAELAKVSPWEPWPIKKGTETDRGVVERVNRPSVDLRAYVADPQRNEPVVGLSALIECCSEKQPPLHLCVACSTHLNKTPAIFHIISNKHRLSYLRKRRPDLFMDWNNSQDPAKMSSCLITMAREVEREENGSLGDIQVVSLDSRTYTEVKSMPFDKALNLLQPIYKEQRQSDLQLCMTPEHRLATLKQEKMESEEYPEEPIPDPLNTEAEYGRAGEDKPIRQEYQLGLGIKTPVIGLRLVIECRSLEGWPPPFYLCQACSVKLTDEQSINKHLTTLQHLYLYIKSCHSSHLEMEKKAGQLDCGLTDLIQSVAKKIEEEEGSGCFQIMNMSEGVYESLKQGDYGYCIKMLKGCNSVEERQTYSKQTDGNITQETAPSGPGSKTLPISHLPAKIRTQEIAYQCQQPDLLVPLRDVTIRNPSTATGCPVPEPFAPHRPDQGEPWSRTSGHLSLSPAGPTHNLCDTLSHHPPAAPGLAKAKAASGHHPSQAAGSSRAACARRSVTIDCGLQGERIATVRLLHSSAAVQRLSTAVAGKRKHNSEGQEGEGPWNYENRQFTSAPQKRSASQAKQNCGVPVKRESTSDFHQLNKGPHPAEIRRASVGHPGNIFIDPSSVAPKSSSCGGLEGGARKPAPLQPAVRDAVRNSGDQSRSKYLTKDRRSEGGPNRTVISPASSTNVAQSAHHATVVCSMTTAGVPQTVSLMGGKLHQSSSLPHKRMDDTAIDAIIRSLSNSDSPPAKIPGIDHDDSQLSPAERLLTNWKAITGIEGRL